MSLTINIYYKGKGEAAKNFAGEMISSGTVDQIRKEPGNEGYQYFFPLEDNETVLLVDRWASQEALDLHHKSPMMKRLMS